MHHKNAVVMVVVGEGGGQWASSVEQMDGEREPAWGAVPHTLNTFPGTNATATVTNAKETARPAVTIISKVVHDTCRRRRKHSHTHRTLHSSSSSSSNMSRPKRRSQTNKQSHTHSHTGLGGQTTNQHHKEKSRKHIHTHVPRTTHQMREAQGEHGPEP
jgi:hypothetical protein